MQRRCRGGQHGWNVARRALDGPDLLFLAHIFFNLFLDSYFLKIRLTGSSPRDSEPGKKTRHETGSGWGSYGPLDGCAVS